MSDQKITIDGKDYNIDKLSEDTKGQLVSMRAVDTEIARLQTLQAICQTARNAYAAALKEALEQEEEAH